MSLVTLVNVFAGKTGENPVGWEVSQAEPAFGSRQMDGVVREAQIEAAKALHAAMPKLGTMPPPESLEAFNKATADYEGKKARVTTLIKVSVTDNR